MTARPWLAAAALLAGVVPLAAQPSATVTGRVRIVRQPDTVPAAGAGVVLHRVGLATQGPVDSLRADQAGRFRFTFPRDTGATYLLSSRHAGIEYFSAPLRSPGVEAVELVVFDTSSAAPVRARSRTLVVSAPDAAGARTVVDWFTLVNESGRTRVGADSTAATWGAPLPSTAQDAAVGDPRFTQFSPEAVLFRGDSVLVTAPLSPGAKALLLEYQLAPGSRGFTLADGAADSMDVFVEEAGARARGEGWLPADTQSFQGRTFYRHRRLGAGGLDLRFPGGGFAPGPTLGVLVGLLALGLIAATWYRGRGRARPAAVAETPAALADRIARLDAEHRARPEDDAARQAWLEERTRLLARLRDALAASERRS